MIVNLKFNYHQADHALLEAMVTTDAELVVLFNGQMEPVLAYKDGHYDDTSNHIAEVPIIPKNFLPNPVPPSYPHHPTMDEQLAMYDYETKAMVAYLESLVQNLKTKRAETLAWKKARLEEQRSEERSRSELANKQFLELKSLTERK